MAGSGDSGRMRSVQVECYVRGYPLLLGGSAEGVQRIGSGSSTRSKKFVILAAIALEHFSDLFTRESKFWAYFLIMRHLLQFF